MAASLPPPDFAELGRTLASTVVFVSNFDFLDLGGYFGGDAQIKPLLHTWSLAVEEQFYVLFPLLMAALWRLGRVAVLRILAGLAVASLILSSWLAFTAPQAAFYLAPSRAFELLTGALIALAATRPMPARQREAAAMAGLGLIVLSLALIHRGMPFPGLAALPPCLGAGLMIHAGKSGPTRAGGWISNRVFLFFGAISYSLYLWHWPILVFARRWSYGDIPPPLLVAAVALAIAAAYGSYRFIERPFQQGRWPTRRVLAAGAATMAAGVAVGLALLIGQGLPQRFPEAARRLFAGADDSNPRRPSCHVGTKTLIPYAEACVFGAAAVPTLAVWSDSHGAELVVALGERLEARGQSALELTASSCPPALGYRFRTRPLCPLFNAQTLEHLARDPRIRTVVMAANYAAYRPENRPAIEAGLHRAIAVLTASGKRVVIMAPIPTMATDPPAALGMMAARGLDPSTFGVSRATHEARNVWARGLLVRLESAGVATVDPADALCDQSLCRAYLSGSGQSAYFNRGHVSLTGARQIAARVPLD